MTRIAVVLVTGAVSLSLLACAGGPQGQAQGSDPQAILDELNSGMRQRNAASHRNEALRLEIEHRDLEDQLRYRRASNQQISGELARYCPNGQPSCMPPPQALLQEAGRRGLIELRAQQPSAECVTLGDGLGGGITDCY